MGKLTDAAANGDRLTGLKELRKVLSERLETCSSSRDMAALSLRLMQCYAEIEEIETERQKEEQRQNNSIEQMRQRIFKQYGKMASS